MAAPFPRSKSHLTDWLKPSRSEALVRVRNSAFALLTVLLVTSLLPLFYSPIACLKVLWSQPETDPNQWRRTMCASEVMVIGVLGLNILQGAYALKYPRAPLPPLPSPAKTIKSPATTPAQRRFKVLSPQSSPQQQKPFSASTSSYPPSPLSTPSRTVQYTFPSPSPFNTSLNSSSMSLPSSPSPMPPLSSSLAAYRGKHSTSVGRAFDGSLLMRLSAQDSDDDDEES
ncbi:hypothetical protein JAAARDRAFT_30307 [Jaapia argillacea MUCL 33604]|uniref:Uncharacterized protein n=1 Tax=Jaapia argillacea MUCL 33604 TaxID=933084 RepID=A0A067Q8C4_9AGAM|nr:hypothetical protein JAAARDRAFT_30307 [Jaapia argillacea MUCL 33604]